MKKLILLLITHIVFSQPVFSQWPTTVDSALFVDYGLYPYLVVDENDQSIIVTYLVDSGIWAKKFDKFGYPLWDGNHVVLMDTAYAWLINQVASTGQWAAAISDGDGGIIVAWEDYRHATFDWEGFPENREVYLQRVDKEGNVLYGPNGMLISGPVVTDHWHSIGDMKSDYHGGYYIGFSHDSTSEQSVLQHYANDGSLLWQRFFDGTFIDVCATNEDGEVFINTKPNENFKRMKLAWGGNCLWPDTLVGIVYDSPAYRHGGAFNDGLGGTIGIGNIGYLKIRRVDSAGQYAWDEVDLNQGQFSYINYASDGKGGIYVNWTRSGIFIQRISVVGTIVFSSENLIVCEDEDCQGSRGIVEDGKSGAITIWGDTRKDTVTSFYAQHIDSSGNILWDSLGLEFHSTNQDPFFTGSPLPLHPDGNGGAILLWNEAGYGNQIFLKQISYEGVLGDVPTSISNNKAQPSLFSLSQNYPNPFNLSTVISYQFSVPSFACLTVYNSLGQKVKELINHKHEAGTHSVTFNAIGLASGVYFYQLKTEKQIITKKMLLIQ